ncbi:hypothetical protein MYX06_00105 [Patescibacteria group bacterium AH-259-L05]|nr:hypothetical protein [Patescibacteria group bacterium AH-259-L05]
MKSETKICQNCKQQFIIEPEDFDFYKKIRMPPPTFCPDCRRQRRSAWRNERSLYKRKCNAPGHNEEIISVFSQNKPLIVYDDRYWWSDKWDPMDYGRPYDFEKPFFIQYRELLERVPLIALSVTNMVNCSYCNVSADDKDCYLISASDGNELVMFSNRTVFNKDSMDIYIGNHSELCYEIVNCSQCFKLFYGFNCTQCVNSAFLYNCTNCSNCFGCTNLRNKSYYIFNQPYTKEEYEQKIKEFDLGSFSTIRQLQERHKSIMLESIHRFAHILKSVNVTGDNVQYAKNCKFCFDVIGKPSAEDCKFLVWAGYNLKDAYDCGPGIALNVEQTYDSFDTGMSGSRLYFTSVVYGSHDVYYSINCHGSNSLFGCYGLRNKQYCILNKQYSKQEYQKLILSITKHMNDMPYKDKKERVYKYGEFFPVELSPFAYNETIAQEYFSLTKQQAIEQDYAWKDPETRDYEITIKSEDLPDHIKDVNDDILKSVIGCEHKRKCTEQCTTAFKIIPDELQFYQKMNLPVPRLCPNCRHYQRLKQRNPLKLWHRKCQCAGEKSDNGVYKNTIKHFHKNNHCPNEFETTYAPNRPEIIYCEKCYQIEVV